MEASILFPEIMSYDRNNTIRCAPPISRSKRRRLLKKKKFRLQKEGKISGSVIDAPLIKTPSEFKPSSSSCSGVSPLSDVVSPDLEFKPSSSSGTGVSPLSGGLLLEPRSAREDLAGKRVTSVAGLDDSFKQPPSSDLGSTRYNLRLRPRK